MFGCEDSVRVSSKVGHIVRDSSVTVFSACLCCAVLSRALLRASYGRWLFIDYMDSTVLGTESETWAFPKNKVITIISVLLSDVEREKNA